MGQEQHLLPFGGRDEGSAALIQGVTPAGILLDEVALMPAACRTVARPLQRAEKQAMVQLQPRGALALVLPRVDFEAQERKALHLHFTMEDNPSLTREIVERYERMYSGVFHRRFILGEWVHAEGLVYDFFDESYIKEPPGDKFERFVISCDYGTVNPASFGLWGKLDGVWYRIKEFYYDSRREKRQKTDAEYLLDLKALAGGRKIESVVVDPSAASFMELLRREGFSVLPAENDVLSGIRITADLLKSGKIVISPSCEDSIREFGLYSWSESATGRDAPKKENDHAMDDIRYFAATIAAEREDMFFATFVERWDRS